MKHNRETIIRPAGSMNALNLREILEYRDLLALTIRRDFVARYKQTILGPAWAIVQPLTTSLVFTIVFAKVAKIPTDDVPPFLFYLSGMLLWQMFSGSVLQGGNSLQANAPLFTKVYFPRIIPSLATQISQLIPFAIQFVIFVGFCAWYHLRSEVAEFHWARVFLFPILLVHVSVLSLGVSLACSAITAKYRDLQHALSFIIQLGLYLTPVIYPVSSINETWRWLIWINPMAAPVSATKWIFLDAGQFPGGPLLISAAISIILFIIALGYFQRVQRSFVDTV